MQYVLCQETREAAVVTVFCFFLCADAVCRNKFWELFESVIPI